MMLMENTPYCFFYHVEKNNDIAINYVVTGLNEELIEFYVSSSTLLND